MARDDIPGASSKILREEDCNIHNHLRNHVHLTNCIHLKNHMHTYSPMSAENALIRDLIVLQRSRSLRDPSTSPSWQSPLKDILTKRLEKGGMQSERQSFGHDQGKESTSGLSASPLIPDLAASRSVNMNSKSFLDGGKENDARKSVVAQTSQVRTRKVDRSNTDASARKCQRHGMQLNKFMDGTGTSKVAEKLSGLQHLVSPQSEIASGKITSKVRTASPKGPHNQIQQDKGISEQAKETSLKSKNLGDFHFDLHERVPQGKTIVQKPKLSGRKGNAREISPLGVELVASKMHKVKATRVPRTMLNSRVIGNHNELSLVSDSLARSTTRANYFSKWDGILPHEAADEAELPHAPRNGCGIPWNWSRIHHRGKTILDMAGRSFSCGLSDSRLRKTEGCSPHISSQREGSPDMLVASNHSGSHTRSDSEVLPLLNEQFGSQATSGSAAWIQNYSGELGIDGSQSLKKDQDSDLASEARSRDHGNLRTYLQSGQLIVGDRHRSLTQKYMPKTFMDLVGQNLVAHALSNAVAQRKVGLLYVFYGPHGTGKTSCARIFARALNCQTMEYPRPCGACNSCIAHELGKSSGMYEVGPAGSLDFENVMYNMEDMVLSRRSSMYRVFIVDDCDSLPSDSWSAISKLIDHASRYIVFVLISTRIDHLPHTIVSRSQKFFFPKLKDADIVSTLHYIAAQENIEIDRGALKLIATRSEGSLRDAEMTLEQLSLLGQRVSIPLVQELVGLISDDKLVDLLDLALSADMVNTVKMLREIMEAGVEPLALMSQLATIITDILAGSYRFNRERTRKFFRHPTLSKVEMERLRQALKILSEAEKQLRMSNGRLTWLTAALLQLAPEQQYIVPDSSTGTSFNHSSFPINNLRSSNGVRHELPANRGSNLHTLSATNINTEEQISGSSLIDIKDIWARVLEKIKSKSLKQFLDREGKLLSVNISADPTAKLMFTSHANKIKAEKFKGCISQAFHSVLHFAINIEICCEAKERQGQTDVNRSPPKDKIAKTVDSLEGRKFQLSYKDTSLNEIIEVTPSSNHSSGEVLQLNNHMDEKRRLESAWVEEAATYHQSSLGPISGRKSQIVERPYRCSLVKGKVSLAHVIQQRESSKQRGRTQGETASAAEKLEKENLRLEPSSKVLFCWKASKVSLRKLRRLRKRTRRAQSLLKLVPCARCPCSRSPK